MECAVQSFLYYQHKTGDYILQQKHSSYELVYYKTGYGNTVIGGETFTYKPGSVAVISPEMIHDEYHKEDGNLYFCLFTLTADFPLKDGVYEISGEFQKDVEYLLEIMKREMAANEFLSKHIINKTFELILTMLTRRFLGSKKFVEEDIIVYARNYIRENAARNVNFEILSESLGYSYDRLRHLFVEKYKVGMYEYLLQSRIASAKKMLADTRIPIQVIAKRCGFKSNTRFNVIFKKFMEITPREYRQKVSSENMSVVNFKKKEDDL